MRGHLSSIILRVPSNRQRLWYIDLIVITTFIVLATGSRVLAKAITSPAFVFCCSEENDLYRVVSANSDCRRFDTAIEAIRFASELAGVLILADGYPEKTTAVNAEVLEIAQKRKLRIYIEYPGSLPGMEFDAPHETHIERAVVSSDFFGDALKRLRIVSINGMHYLPTKAVTPHIVAARVAGFDHAVFGLPKKTAPILFEIPDKNALIATTKLSHFVTGRYAPKDSWNTIWVAILNWLNPSSSITSLRWTSTVRATYDRDQALPDDFELQSLKRGLRWFDNAHMIVHPSVAASIAAKDRVDFLPDNTPPGDGSCGGLEAVVSVIHQDGTQSISTAQRGDCICETAMAMAFSGHVLKRSADSTTARNLLNYYLFESDARKKERGNPKHGAYGLIAWGISTPAWYKANYGDDNARQILSTLAAASLTHDECWDEAMMMCLLANLRTTGQLGFRGNRIDVEALNAGWQRYFSGRPVNLAPHFEAYLWACYLWAFEQTGNQLFFDRAETALKMTMARHTDGWRWTNGLAQERARIILPLAWLVRARDTVENRKMLMTAVDGLLALQDECGAIREELGLPGHGAYPPPPSNEAYGTSEASLIAKNGDPVSDLLYTTNFAFLGLHEAAAATGNRRIVEAEKRLAEFLCRIQIRSDVHSQLDGGWFRAFDFGRWEHWGCNADHGWGAWAIESGWTQGWITSVLAMRQMNTSLWDLTNESRIERHHDRLRQLMMPDEDLQLAEEKAAANAAGIEHAAVGKSVSMSTWPSPGYPGLGGKSLIDGKIGDANHASGLWLGFHQDNLVAVIDLGQPTQIRTLGVRFLQSINLGIHLPTQVVFAASNDSDTFDYLGTFEFDDGLRAKDRQVHVANIDTPKIAARYLRIRADNVGIIPTGYRAAGKKAWLFVDEILVNQETN